MWNKYYIPTTLDEALTFLAEPDSRIVAGATDLLLEIKRGTRPGVGTLIDITRIEGLDQITLDQEGWVHIGPLATHNDCADSPILIEKAFALSQACWQVGSPQIRARGTVAGNIVTASPANDTIPVLIALGAKLTLRSIRGERGIALEDFYQGVRKCDLGDDEILTDISFPALSEGAGSAYFKLALRRAQAISIVNAAAVIRWDGEVVSSASIALGAVAPTIIHAADAENYLVGKRLSPEVIEQAGRLAMTAAAPITDIRGSDNYRRNMVKVCVERCLDPLVSGTERQGYPERRVRLERPGRAVKPLARAELLSHASTIQTTINGKQISVVGGDQGTLLDLLRKDLYLTGTKEGCAEGECGACTIILDDQAVMACLVPAPRAHGAVIQTLEGLSDGEVLHHLQNEFIEEGAVQCGFCTPGLIMSGMMLLDEIEDPSLEEIKVGISGNLCRCTGYYKIISAIHKAAVASQA